MADADLRPMTLGEVLDRTFKIYRNHFWLFAGITTLPSGVLLIFRIANSAWTVSRTVRPGQFPFPYGGGSILAVVLIGIASLLAFFVLTGYAQAATVFAVSDIYLGGNSGLRESYKRVGTKAFRVLWIYLMLFVVVGIGCLFFLIPGIWLMCRAAVSVPVAMLEDAPSVRSIERSMHLTKGHAIQIFVIFLLVFVLFYVVALVFQFPLIFVMGAAMRGHQGLAFLTLLAVNLSSFISEIVIWPVATIAISLMYYNLRVRKEAFDIQHQMATLGPNPTLGTPSAV